MEVEKISTSTKTALFLTAMLCLTTFAAADYYYGDSGSPFSGTALSGDTGFSIPEYGSQKEVLTRLVAPFLLVAILFQIGIQRALMFTLDEDKNKWLGSNVEYKKEKKKLKRQSLIMSLVITGMLVPTPFFKYINGYVSLIFGSMFYILFGAVFLAFIWVLWSGFSGN